MEGEWKQREEGILFHAVSLTRSFAPHGVENHHFDVQTVFR